MMKAITRIVVAVFTFVLLGAGAARAASTTNFSDQWWIPAESGWGASVLQQADVLFIDLFVYGNDGKATWFTAAATFQASSPAGHVVFTGDLYLTNGPYFGNPWNPGALGYRQVGTLTFDANTVNDARLTYTVDGTPVVKDVTRQFWRFESLTGSYYGGWTGDQTACTLPGDNGHFEAAITFQIAQNAANSITMQVQETVSGDSYTFTGPYSQAGHMGHIASTLSAGGISGPVTFFEIERTIAGITGRFVGTAGGGGGSCNLANGYIAGVRR